MPYKTFKHFCNVKKKELISSDRVCEYCGNNGEDNGWYLSAVGGWGNYVDKTGFSPFGPHRRLLDALFFPFWKTCSKCNDMGIIDADNNPNAWQRCPDCDDSKGGTFIGSTEDMNWIIYVVLSAYPDSVGGKHADEYQEIYEKYKFDLENPVPDTSIDGIIKDTNTNGGGLWNITITGDGDRFDL
ncbi:MAG: hypothetical protein ISR95_00325 [Candidatus Marinimicrobia bacterium]|nr:hypothetical protein [Candidatus Neomarinimicrobiota bacterium]MBL7046076.1 hypothetical protein [Candidatus Neomarinimicrobiota bacterium]